LSLRFGFGQPPTPPFIPTPFVCEDEQLGSEALGIEQRAFEERAADALPAEVAVDVDRIDEERCLLA
jgi:hypothetical protein